MEKLDQINFNLTGFFQDIVKFIQAVWQYIEKFFTKDATDPLYEGQNEGISFLRLSYTVPSWSEYRFTVKLTPLY